ncbi:MAG: ATP-binding protein [Chloroflexota bacterium]|nr:ATP-binding protein [Chloroflexota bacterium]MDE2931225.1 ATP-binding protein [Chloroflexota bacterium]
MSTELRLKVETRHDELDRVTAAIEDFALEADWPLDLAFKVNLALEEIVINVMNYGHDDGLHEIDITLTTEEDSLTIEIVDDGRPFDPLHDAPIPDVNAELEDRNIGGLGIHFVRKMMDDVRYRREEGKNHLTLVTSLAK